MIYYIFSSCACLIVILNRLKLYLFNYFLNSQATEVEKARSVARKALSIIDGKEEQEKLNIWTALLNLENLYGTKVNYRNVNFL